MVSRFLPSVAPNKLPTVRHHAATNPSFGTFDGRREFRTVLDCWESSRRFAPTADKAAGRINV